VRAHAPRAGPRDAPCRRPALPAWLGRRAVRSWAGFARETGAEPAQSRRAAGRATSSPGVRRAVLSAGRGGAASGTRSRRIGSSCAAWEIRETLFRNKTNPVTQRPWGSRARRLWRRRPCSRQKPERARRAVMGAVSGLPVLWRVRFRVLPRSSDVARSHGTVSPSPLRCILHAVCGWMNYRASLELGSGSELQMSRSLALPSCSVSGSRVCLFCAVRASLSSGEVKAVPHVLTIVAQSYRLFFTNKT
ncbi:PREDICTED: uncharacterized protein LOC106149957, partial [Chinchilla lanigera]|uniref:uncharacterized protein LOC106149957 n=1 Tax=Chinchilla lanigera TaxID=34839 RepID=UPI000695A705